MGRPDAAREGDATSIQSAEFGRALIGCCAAKVGPRPLPIFIVGRARFAARSGGGYDRFAAAWAQNPRHSANFAAIRSVEPAPEGGRAGSGIR